MGRRLPSVNQVIAAATEQVKLAQAQEKTASAQPPSYATPLAVELQKVAAMCREDCVITVDEVTEFARRLEGSSNGC